MRSLPLTLLVLAGCGPAVRAGDYYAAPLERPAAPHAAVEARWRIQPAPSGCAAVAAPIVFVPALGLTQHTWSGVTAALDACRARVLVDLPGIGEAPPTAAFDDAAVLAALEDVVDAVAGEGRVVLAGHSLGGAIVTQLAARLGARVEALVLVAAPVAPITIDRWERLLLLPSLWPPFLHLLGAADAVRFGLGRVSSGGDAASALDVALIAADWSDHQRRGAILQYYRAFLDAAGIARSEALLSQLRVPTLLVWGSADRIVPLAVMRAAERRLAATRVTTHVVPGVGHLVPLAAPRPVAAAIDHFLSALPVVVVEIRNRHSEITPGRRPEELVWSRRRTLFPLVGLNLLFPLDGRTDLSLVAGLARGGLDPRYPIEAGRLAFTVGATARVDGAGRGSFAYLRATARLELVWRWGGGYHVDGTLLVDPRDGRVGGYGAIGYTPSVVPWVRAFVGGGALPGEGARLLLGVEVDARLTGWLY